jgi:tyrosyl-tRNA synthetase
VFSDRQAPAEMEETSLPASSEPQLLFKIIVAAGLAESNKDAQRVIAQGGVLVDDAKVSDPRATLDANAGKSYVLKVGKRRFARVAFT